MIKIFISYSSKNHAFIKELVADLDVLLDDVEIWYDDELKGMGGQKWWNRILENIRTCQIFICALSPQMLASVPCLREYDYALKLGKPILPLMVDTVEVRDLPRELQEAQLVNYIQRTREQQKALKISIRNLPTALPLPDPLPEPPEVPLNPVGVVFDKITRLTVSENDQRLLLMEIEDLYEAREFQADVPEMLARLIKRDDVMIGRQLRRAQDFLSRIERPADQKKDVAPKPDPVKDALTHARESHKTGKRNADWKPYITTFPDLKIPDMRFCLVPTGTFQMGSDKYDSEKPIHAQTFDKPYYIAQTPVTNAQWKLGVKAGAVKEPVGKSALKWYNDPQMANAPVVGVSWWEVQKFVTWAGCRLPTEREWEYAARGIENLKYPWGNEFIADNVVYDRNSGGKPWDVTSKPAGVSWVGALHLSGNVWEWCASVYEPYPYRVDGSREPDSGDRTNVLRGGSWNVNADFLRASYRYVFTPDVNYISFGVRCARSS